MILGNLNGIVLYRGFFILALYANYIKLVSHYQEPYKAGITLSRTR